MLERPDRRAANRERQRRSRKRRRAGIALLRVPVDEFSLIEALQKAGRLAGDDGLQRAHVEREVGRLVEDFVARWLHPRCHAWPSPIAQDV
jgi:hypothetical protein